MVEDRVKKALKKKDKEVKMIQNTLRDKELLCFKYE